MKKFYFTHLIKKGLTLPYLTLLVFFFCCSTLNGQVSFDNNAVSDEATSTVDITFTNFTVPTGNNRILIVWAGAGAGSNPPVVDGVTYNSQSFTQAVSVDDLGNGTGHRKASIWYLVLGSGSAITSNIVVDFASIVSTKFAGAGSFTNVDQNTPIGNTNSTFGTGTNSSISISTSANDGVVDVLAKRTQVVITPGVNQTLIFSQNASSNIVGGASFEVASGASTDMSWSWSGSAETAHAAAELNQVAAAPIELKYFRAHPNTQSVTLDWATATEVNNDYFTIERSVNGTDFEPVGEVKGAGTSYEELTYTFKDTHLPTGQTQLYYRLRQTDYDGTSTVKQVVTVELERNNGFNITSVFAEQNQVSVTFTTATENEVEISLYDLNGRLLLSEKHFANEGVNRVEMNTEGLVSGAYLVQISDGRQVVSKQFFKE